MLLNLHTPIQFFFFFTIISHLLIFCMFTFCPSALLLSHSLCCSHFSFLGTARPYKRKVRYYYFPFVVVVIIIFFFFLFASDLHSNDHRQFNWRRSERIFVDFGWAQALCANSVRRLPHSIIMISRKRPFSIKFNKKIEINCFISSISFRFLSHFVCVCLKKKLK